MIEKVKGLSICGRCFSKKHVNNMVVQLTGEEKKNARLALASFLKVKLVSGSVFSA